MEPLEQRIASVAALDHPLRRALFALLEQGWTSRDAAAEALEVARPVAAFHLDRLVEAGVAEVRYERTTGRTGPGAGRPAKLYRLVRDEVAATVPDRRYDLAGAVLADAVAASAASGAPVSECLRDAAVAAGRAAGSGSGSSQEVLDLLATHGYEPVAGRRGEITLANCPFHRLAEEHRELVCGMNLDFLSGVLDGSRLAPRLDPAPGRCCVVIGRP